MKHALIAASVFALSLVAGYAIRSRSQSSPAVSTETPSHVAEERGNPPVEPPSLDPPALEPALAEIARPEYAPSGARIWGRVRTIGGAAVRGARVEAWPIPWVDDESPLESLVPAWAEEQRAASDRRIQTTTDESGHFEFALLSRADYRVVASHDRWTISRAQAGEDRIRPGSYIAFVARAVAPVDVEIRVLSAEGREPDEAYVTLKPVSRDDWSVVSSDPQLSGSPAGRAFRWTPSNRRLRVSVDTELTAFGADGSASDVVVVSPLEPPGKVVLRFSERRGILLETVYPEGCEKTVVRTGLMLIDGNRPPTVAQFARAAKWTDYYRGLAGATSRLVEDIPAGTYMVGVTLGQRRQMHFSGSRGLPTRGGVVDAWTTVSVAAGFATARVEIPEPSLDGAISTLVRGPDGDLLERVEFRLFYTPAERPTRQRGDPDWRRRADGSYLLYPRSDDARSILSKAAGILDVVAIHKGHGQGEATVVLGAAPSVDITIARPGRLALSFTGAEGAEMARRLRVRLEPRGRGGASKWLSGSSKESPIVFETITPGEYEAKVTFSCGNGGALELATEAILIESGEATALSVAIPPLHEVTLRAGGAAPRMGHYMIEGEGLSIRATIGMRRDGSFFLPAGDYEVFARMRRPKEGPPLLRFTVPEVTDLELPNEDDR